VSGTDGSERPLRVAYIMSRFPKLTETFILREMLAMERVGVQVELYPLLRERGDLVQPDARRFVERAHYLPFVSRPILASQLAWLRDGRRRRRYLEAFADMLRGTWRSPKFQIGGLGIFPKVAHAARLMADDGIDHVHCHFATHPALAGWLIHRLVGIPFSFTAHGSDLHVDRTMLPTKVREAAFVVAISEDNRRVIEADCGPSSAARIEVIHCGVDPAAFTVPDRAPDRPLGIVAVGTLHEVKGQTHLIEACRRLVAAGLDVRCRLIGDGVDRERLQAQIDEADLGSTVTLVGQLTGDGVTAELAAADVLVAPSVPTSGGKREGIPVVLMEAMASGLPVVASRLSGIPELVDDGVSGLLVPPGDPQALADALRRLADDPVLRERLGQAGRATIVREFDVVASADRLARRIVAAGGGRSPRAVADASERSGTPGRAVA
jgi:colanic acid/amylovoran biosynthesis glycosyltransferase